VLRKWIEKEPVCVVYCKDMSSKVFLSTPQLFIIGNRDPAKVAAFNLANSAGNETEGSLLNNQSIPLKLLRQPNVQQLHASDLIVSMTS
jgi:hypothetical protein